ncbi:MAG: 2-C-methyl-D-erythritol 4-phosphate cytidylyltransferase [Flavobacteriales bacterium]|nr:2-C-methyl-D-erythritol 4-phosphate cytidylyltransferase [Flavobacteriales bacterium]
MQNAVVIVAGGSGKRMGTTIPKQFLEVNGLPILGHTIRQFYVFDPAMEIVVTLPKEWADYWQEQVTKFDLPKHVVVEGGKERFHSVLNGLNRVSANVSIVGVHDAVGPCVSVETIARCYEAAAEHGAAIPVLAMVNSLRKVSSSGNESVDRQHFRSVQTPQCFQASILRRGYENGFRNEFTDDASVVEYAGNSIELVQGNPENVKATNPQDLVLLRHFLSATD